MNDNTMHVTTARSSADLTKPNQTPMLLRGCIVLETGMVSSGLHCFLRWSFAGSIVVLVPGCCWTYSAFSVQHIAGRVHVRATPYTSSYKRVKGRSHGVEERTSTHSHNPTQLASHHIHTQEKVTPSQGLPTLDRGAQGGLEIKGYSKAVLTRGRKGYIRGTTQTDA